MISAIVLTKNEEKNIETCLKALTFAHEIILIDDYSTDNTIKIGRKFGAKVYRRYLSGNFAEQRNFGLSKARGDWVLFVDSDEIVSKSLKKEILLETKKDDYYGFYIKRRDFFLGKEMKYGEAGNVKLLRLAKKNVGKWRRKVHETWEVEGEVRQLVNPLLHYPHLSISEFISDINRYSSLHALELTGEGKKSNLLKIIVWPTGKFFVNYFLKWGFLDGAPGFIMAAMMSFHSFLGWTNIWMD